MYTQYGVREICDVVFKAKANMTVGNRKFFKGEPVIYFDTLKTSTLEGAATTVYATGGRGNSRLIAWEGERTVTFTMEDALISPVGFMLLSGAGLIEAGKTGGDTKDVVNQHMTATVDIKDVTKEGVITIKNENGDPIKHISPDDGALIYVYPLQGGKMFTEPYLAKSSSTKTALAEDGIVTILQNETYTTIEHKTAQNYDATQSKLADISYSNANWATDYAKADAFLVDFYVKHTANAMQIEITADSFGGNFYIEASTLFRDTDGVDYPAEFIIPNAKVQSNFTFSMASSGDPSTFTFTCDAFPDYTRFNRTKKVIAALQVITGAAGSDVYREKTATGLTF